MKKLIFVLSVLMILSSTFAQWVRTNGPEGAAISSLTNIDGIIYAGTNADGLFASTDDGNNWIPLHNGIETYEVTSIISNAGFLFASTSGYGVYRSSDGGQTWLAPSNGNTLGVTSMVIDDTYLFAATIGDGVQCSSDNGVTWEEKLSGFIGIGAICKSGDKVIASTSNYTLYTTDHGETWAYITQLDGAEIFSYYCIGDTIFAGGRNKIYRSTNNGNSFTTININFTFSIVNIYAITASGSTVFAATSYDGVYKSTDFGSTWFSSNVGMGPKDARVLAVTNSSTLIAGTNYVGIYRSTDLGLNWYKSMSGFPAGSSILSFLISGSSVYAGTRDGIYLTDNNGNEWIKLTGTNDTINYCTVWGICEKDNNIFAGTFLQYNSTVYKSSDKGLTWIRSGTGLPPDLTFVFGMATSGNNILAATDEGIFYSSNNGTNWFPSNSPNQYTPGIATGSDHFVYAAVPGIGIYKSADDGINWVPSLQSPTVDYVEVSAIDNFAFAGAFFGGARFSSNYGGTWAVSSGFPTDASVFALAAVGEGLVVAGTDLSPLWIYASFNNGASFSPFSEGLSEVASVEVIASNEIFIFAGTNYQGVWRRLRPGVVNIDDELNAPHSFYLSQNYPNPFNPTTKISFTIPRTGFVTLKVYDVLGNEVATLVSEEKPSGEYEVEFSGNGLTSGIYFYQIKSENFIETKKMILLK